MVFANFNIPNIKLHSSQSVRDGPGEKSRKNESSATGGGCGGDKK